MTRFRPCIDLHDGRVKQIVGSTLDAPGGMRTNFETDDSPAHFARRYRSDGLTGGHVIMLGTGNQDAAMEALQAYPGGLQIGGGIHPGNARAYLDAGASHVIVTSWIFSDSGELVPGKLEALSREVGRERLVVDLSCRATAQRGWVVAMNRWRTLTGIAIDAATLDYFAGFCAEFLIHAADVEGMCGGMDEELIRLLGAWGRIPVTYAGGARSSDDLARVQALSDGKVDLTIGSALDIFGGTLVRYEDCVKWNQAVNPAQTER